MKVLLDTHIVLAIMEKQPEKFGVSIRDVLFEPQNIFYVSVATLWEIAIKVRLRKLHIAIGLDALPAFIGRLGAILVAINQHHVIAEIDPEPATRDPFDRLLLAQCRVESFRLLTADRLLRAHPLAESAP